MSGVVTTAETWRRVFFPPSALLKSTSRWRTKRRLRRAGPRLATSQRASARPKRRRAFPRWRSSAVRIEVSSAVWPTEAASESSRQRSGANATSLPQPSSGQSGPSQVGSVVVVGGNVTVVDVVLARGAVLVEVLVEDGASLVDVDEDGSTVLEVVDDVDDVVVIDVLVVEVVVARVAVVDVVGGTVVELVELVVVVDG